MDEGEEVEVCASANFNLRVGNSARSSVVFVEKNTTDEGDE